MIRLFLIGLLLTLSTLQQKPDLTAVDRFLEEQMAAQRLPGLAVAITQKDQILYIKGYGAGITPETQFMIASVSKSFTALAVMQLVDAGKIDLDAPVQTYLPEFSLADSPSTITIRELLNQQSGLGDRGFPDSQLPQPTSIEQRVDSLRSAKLIAQPGTEYHYFNPNYAVLARVVEVVSGEPFSDYLQSNIFDPLQMQNTTNVVTAQEAAQKAPLLAHGHLIPYGIALPLSEMSGYVGGSGGVISTAEDMAKYLILQTSGNSSLISDQSLDLMHTPPSGSPYAMGWIETTDNNGVRILQHDGVLSVFYTDIVLLPDSGYGFILMYNVNGLAPTLTAFTQIKQGMIDLLTAHEVNTSSFTVPVWGMVIGLITLIGIILTVRSLLLLRQWSQRTASIPLWRLLPGIVWSFVPALVFITLPTLVTLMSDRAFSYEQLYRFMPDIALWLCLCGIAGLFSGVWRLFLLARRTGSQQA